MTKFPHRIGDKLWVDYRTAIGTVIGIVYENNSWQVKLEFQDPTMNAWYDIDSTTKPTIMQLFLYG